MTVDAKKPRNDVTVEIADRIMVTSIIPVFPAGDLSASGITSGVGELANGVAVTEDPGEGVCEGVDVAVAVGEGVESGVGVLTGVGVGLGGGFR